MKTHSRERAIVALLLAGLVAIADYILKRVALGSFPDESMLVRPGFFELAVHKNFGVAFDIPFRIPVIVVLTVVVLVLLVHMATKNWKKNPNVSVASWFMIFGAIGNLIDRIFLGYTVDYLIFFGRSALNLSDILIVIGVVLLLFAAQRKHKHDSKTPQSSQL